MKPPPDKPTAPGGSLARLVRPSDVFMVTKLMHVPDNAATGKLARDARTAAGLSLREVARRMQLSAMFISDLERGRRCWTDRHIARYRSAICPRHTVIDMNQDPPSYGHMLIAAQLAKGPNAGTHRREAAAGDVEMQTRAESAASRSVQ